MEVPPWFAELLERELSAWVKLSVEQVASLYEHYEVLTRWNEKINLTSVSPGPEIVIRHYCESLFFAAQFPSNQERLSIVDIGSGAGFPGVPLATLKPGWAVTLVESNQRKAVFLRESTRGMGNISVLAERVEDVAGSFDWAVSRAVDQKQILKAIPRLADRVGLMLGKDDFLAIQAVRDIAWSEPIRLPWGDRRLCIFGVSRGT